MTRIDDNGVGLVQDMLRYQPERRITAEAAMTNPFFDDVPQEIKSLA